MADKKPEPKKNNDNSKEDELNPIFRTLRNLIFIPGTFLKSLLAWITGMTAQAVAAAAITSVLIITIVLLTRGEYPVSPEGKRDKIQLEIDKIDRKLERLPTLDLKEGLLYTRDSLSGEILKLKKDCAAYTKYINEYGSGGMFSVEIYPKLEELECDCIEPDCLLQPNKEECRCAFYEDYIDRMGDTPGECYGFYLQKDAICDYDEGEGESVKICKTILNSIRRLPIEEQCQACIEKINGNCQDSLKALMARLPNCPPELEVVDPCEEFNEKLEVASDDEEAQCEVCEKYRKKSDQYCEAAQQEYEKLGCGGVVPPEEPLVCPKYVWVNNQKYETVKISGLCFINEPITSMEGKKSFTRKEALKACTGAWRLPCHWEMDQIVKHYYSGSPLTAYQYLPLKNKKGQMFWFGTVADDDTGWGYAFVNRELVNIQIDVTERHPCYCVRENANYAISIFGRNQPEGSTCPD